ncbi:type II toxin-antitoxin system prevent-host-death family antitoxin [Aphanizomenon sp. UHCC 0183]|jgi:prevent-host-death family protein|uniref:type II toxin-antitoxin system prevent-host-death family antitoxin n=1 Tax=Aphanizomenon sp. UHCC 0183 TaxID=2590028 RepID=UPI00144750B7|nr:type II toxin-antitoxin system prevent-host-death family antitoxin [Aphanizomenon sp. UHCC 0183]MDK2409392.1 type II toxin-antitoxin system prevent-host-death family antitoxin [Aphanizomenon sp. 202]MDK2459310.1 type II toxin-antitoxin system prevent-host-death family antitoxin [Aphanizomenon sp. PH219]MTJ32025.1 type II toxin-antitoxin system Phd/YefM family antitoxin [Aphanizomenon sp. UHCC 0183]QSV69925.1 MAG: type II toxin-antitoxin system Phd/YefM family antitoxin [Aphanizomenon flos-aq
MINLSQDIQSLSTFKRNTNELINQMKETGNPLILTVNGKAELVVQDAASYQKILDHIKQLETIIETKKQLEPTKSNNQKALELLKIWEQEGDEQEQTETLEYLSQSLAQDHFSNRSLFSPLS